MVMHCAVEGCKMVPFIVEEDQPIKYRVIDHSTKLKLILEFYVCRIHAQQLIKGGLTNEDANM